MVTSFLNRFAPIDFTRYIDRLTDRFTGREWLFEKHIEPWLENKDNEQFYLLTGEPGVGKSAIVAELIKRWQTQPGDEEQGKLAAYHFCRAGDVETVRPGRVLRSIAAQLGKTLPHYGKALNKVLEQVHLNIDANINIDTLSNSQVTGIYIENLKDLDPREELRLLIQAPLAELPAIYEEEKTELPSLKVFLIDSLDEAVTTTGRDNVATLLAALSQTNELPPWIRFILTARPNSSALEGFQSIQNYKLEELLKENLDDIQQYVDDLVQELITLPESEFQTRLEQAELSAETLVDKVKTLSEGNFLYTRLVMDGISTGELSVKNLSALPKNLNEVYQRFLRHRCPVRKWVHLYQPILGTLTVTQEAISTAQLTKFIRIASKQIEGEAQVESAIGILRQFLDEVEDEQGQKLYTIFHQSLREYLLNKKHNQDFWCDVIEQHSSIVKYYKRETRTWQNLKEVDQYGLLHIAKHLFESGQRNLLYRLLIESPSWMDIKFDKCIGDSAYLSDLEIALNSFLDPTDPGQLVTLIQLHSAQHAVKQRVSSYNDTDLEILVWIDREAEALNHARLRSDAKRKFDGLIIIFHTLLNKENSQTDLLGESREITEKILDVQQRIEALVQLGATYIDFQDFIRAGSVIELILDNPQAVELIERLLSVYLESGDFIKAEFLANKVSGSLLKVKLLGKLAVSLARIKNNTRAKATFSRAKEVIEKIEDNWQETKTEALAQLAVFLAEAGCLVESNMAFIEARKTISDIKDSQHKLKILKELAVALNQAKRSAEATAVFKLALQEVKIFEIEQQAYALKNLAVALEEIGNTTEANFIFSEARDVAGRIKNDRMRGEALEEIAVMLARVGQGTKALEVTEDIFGIEGDYLRKEALRDLAVIFAKLGEFSKAREAIQRIETTGYSDMWQFGLLADALKALASALAERGEFSEARKVASEIDDDRRRAEAFHAVAIALAKTGSFTEAQIVAKSIIDNSERAETLRDLAVLLAKSNHKAEAHSIFSEARETSGKISYIYRYCNEAIQKTAITFSQAGQFAKARQLIKTVENEHHDWQRMQQVWFLSGLIPILVSMDCKEEIDLTITDAQEIFKGIDNPYSCARVQKDLAVKLSEVRLFAEARSIAEEIERSPSYSSSSDKDEALSALVIALSQTGHFVEAQDIVEEIQDYSFYKYRQQALHELVIALAKAGQFAKAVQIAEQIENNWQSNFSILLKEKRFSEAKVIIENLSTWEKDAALRDLSKALIQEGQFTEAQTAIREIQEGRQWAEGMEALRELVRALTKQGDLTIAKQIVDEIQDISSQSQLLGEMAIALIELQQLSEAEQIIEEIKIDFHKVRPIGELAIALIQLEQNPNIECLFDTIQMIAKQESYNENESIILIELATYLIQAKQFNRAWQVAKSIKDNDKRMDALKSLAIAMAQVNFFVKAFAVLDIEELDHLLVNLNDFRSTFEKVESGLSVKVIQEAVRIAGWVRPTWQKIWNVLSNMAIENAEIN